MGEPGVRVLGVVLGDQYLVGVVLQGGVGGAVGSLGGEFHYTVRLFVQPKGFFDIVTPTNTALASLRATG